MRFYSVCMLAVALFFESAASATVEDAQKAYLSGDWIRAAESFEAACPALEAKARSECALWGVLARSQAGNAKDFSLARKKLDSLIFATPDSLPVFSDLYMTRAQFELYLKRPDLSLRSLKTAFAKAEPRQLAVIFQVCQSLYKASPTDSVHSLCAEIECARSGTAKDSSTTAGPSSSSANLSSSSAENLPIETSSSEESASELSSSGTASIKEWSLQVGAFGISSNAEMLANSLRAKKLDVTIRESQTDERTLFLVHVGEFESREQAIEYGKAQLEPLNLEFQPVKMRKSFQDPVLNP